MNTYSRDGFSLHPEAVVPAELLSAAQSAANAVRDGSFDTGRPPSHHPGYDAAVLCKINDAHLASHDLQRLVSHPALGALASKITGARALQVWASQLLIKPPSSGAQGNVGWHQDRQYWPYWQAPEGLLTLWIALSDVTESSGPMRFVRGSHNWGFRDEGDFFGRDHDAQRQAIQVPEGDRWDEVSAVLPAGGVSLHHCLSFHGSGPNTSPHARCSIAVHLRTEVTRPVSGSTDYYVSHLADPAYCPVLHGCDADFDL